MQTQYENQGGLLVIPGTNQCAGYIFNFEGHGAYHPIGKVETPQGPTKEEIDTHNAILAKAEREAMIQKGIGTFYLHKEPWRTNERGERIRSLSNDYVSQWCGEWKGKAFVREGYSYGFCRVKTNWVWFTGPDGKRWYGMNKGDQDCFTGRRLKIQPKKG